MKALKILAIVFGILLLLTGGALLVGSAVAGKGQTAIDNELAKSGYAGPVQGTVTAVDGRTKYVTVAYTDKQGQEQTGVGPSTNQSDPPAVGEKVSVYYLASSPDQIVVLDIPGGGSLVGVGGALRTGGIATLIVGAVLLLAGILGLVLGKKTPAIAAAYPSGPPDQAPGLSRPAVPAAGPAGSGIPAAAVRAGLSAPAGWISAARTRARLSAAAWSSTRLGRASSTRLSPGNLRSTRPARVSSTRRRVHLRPLSGARPRAARRRAARIEPVRAAMMRNAWSRRPAACLDLIRLGVSDRIVRLLRRGRRDLLRNCVADRTVRLHRSARLNTRS